MKRNKLIVAKRYSYVKIVHYFVQGTYMFTLFLISKRFCNILSSILRTYCSISYCCRNCWNNLVKDVCGFCSSRLKPSTTSSDTEGRRKFPFVRTNLLTISLMWASLFFFCFLNVQISVFVQIFLLTSGYRLWMPHCGNKISLWKTRWCHVKILFSKSHSKLAK